MNELKFSDLEASLKNKELEFHNFYNTDLNLPIYYAVKYYLSNPDDNPDVDQKLHILFADIEVYWKDKNIKFEFDVSNHPINAITVYSTETKTFKSFYLLYDFNCNQFGITPGCNFEELIKSHISTYQSWLIKEKYIKPDEQLEISIYNDELKLILDVWKYIRAVDPIILSGFNADRFDYPYIYRRLLKLFNDDKVKVDSIISQFNYVELQRNGFLKIIDYSICDISHCYRPRDDQGLNLGQKLASYSLDFVSDEELGLTKLEYRGKNVDIHEFYEKDPINYLLYNIADVALTVRLNEKLKHIELQNLIRRNMKLNFSQSLIGSSALYDAFVLHELLKSDQKIRHGIVTEAGKEITADKLEKLPIPNTKNNKIKAEKISKQEYSTLAFSYEGAYVTQPKAQITNNGLIIDLDAGSLYPSMIRQFNIGFDTYKARIISPLSYKLLNLLQDCIGRKALPNNLFTELYGLIEKYVKKEDYDNKTKANNQFYFIIMYHINVLVEKNIPLDKIFKPSSNIESVLLIHYLIPLLDIFDMIHLNHESYNNFVYDYLFEDSFNNLKAKYNYVYIINNANSPNQWIEKVDIDNILAKLNNFIVTINGACYSKHSDKLGLFVNYLTEMAKLRKSYRKLANEFPRGSEKYEFYNSRQLAIKVLMNSAYGVLGLKTFRYSNHHLAQSITASGKLTLKLAQSLADKYLASYS